MPRTSDMIPSMGLKQGDVGVGKLWTIKGVENKIFESDDKPAESKWILHFEEIEKGLTLNKTNIQRLEIICKSDNTDDWIGQKIVVFWDETVEYMGKITGGLRVRAKKSAEAQDLPF